MLGNLASASVSAVAVHLCCLVSSRLQAKLALRLQVNDPSGMFVYQPKLCFSNVCRSSVYLPGECLLEETC